MSGPARVLHVLPHAGAGAQTYIDVLDGLDGYEFEIFELSSSRSPGGAASSIARRLRRSPKPRGKLTWSTSTVRSRV